jgi:phage virion morphogenesis protein
MVAVSMQVRIGEARQVLARLRQGVSDLEPLFQIWGGILENSTRDRFAEQHGPGGIPWPQSRRAIAQGGRTLVDTGGLVGSIISRASARGVEWGIMAKTPSAKFAASHQFGVTITPKKGPYLIFRGADGHVIFARSVTIPARPFLGVDENDKADLKETGVAYLEGLASHD